MSNATDTATLHATPPAGPRGTVWSIRTDGPTGDVLGYIKAPTHEKAADAGRAVFPNSTAYPHPLPAVRPEWERLRRAY